MVHAEMTNEELNAAFERAYEAQHAPVVHDVYTPSRRQRWAEAKFTHKLAAIIILCFVLPWTILIVGIVCLAIWTEITGVQ